MESLVGRRARTTLTRAVLVGALVVGTVGWFATAGGASDRTIRTEGTEQFVPNTKVSSNLRFSPGHTVVDQGDAITISHSDQTTEPHTLSIVNASDVPTTVEDVFGCGEPGTVCDEVFSTVGPQITDENVAQFVNVSGGTGLDGRLDTVWLPPGTSISVQVTALSGTTLHYMCAIHAWMQGTITVH
jgi:hypothetical protein